MSDKDILIVDCVDWMCPVCDWVITGIERSTIKIEPACPGCGCRKYSEFIPVAGLTDTDRNRHKKP